MDERADDFLFGAARFQRALDVGTHLYFRAAHRRQHDDGQQFTRLAVQSLARHKVAEAKLCQKAGHRLGELPGQPCVAVLDLVAVHGFLQLKPLFEAVGFGRRFSVFKRERYAVRRKDLVHRGDRVERLGEADERRALIDRLADRGRRDADVETRADMRFELRQRLIDGQDRDGDQLAHFVAERAGIAHFAEDEPL